MGVADDAGQLLFQDLVEQANYLVLVQSGHCSTSPFMRQENQRSSHPPTLIRIARLRAGMEEFPQVPKLGSPVRPREPTRWRIACPSRPRDFLAIAPSRRCRLENAFRVMARTAILSLRLVYSSACPRPLLRYKLPTLLDRSSALVRRTGKSQGDDRCKTTTSTGRPISSVVRRSQ